MRGSYGEPGMKRESSAPYPVPRMGHNNSANNSGGGGLELANVGSPMGQPFANNVGGHGNMQTVTLDQVAFQRRPTPTSVPYNNTGNIIEIVVTSV